MARRKYSEIKQCLKCLSQRQETRKNMPDWKNYQNYVEIGVFFRYLCGICVKSERSLLYSYRVATTFLIIFCSFDLQLVCPIFWVYSLNVAACIITASFV